MTGNLKDLSLVGMSAGRITGLKVDHLLTKQKELKKCTLTLGNLSMLDM